MELIKMNLRLEYGLVRRKSLLFLSLIIMIIALVVVFSVFCYISGIDILSRIIPGIPRSHPIDFCLNGNFPFLSEATTSLVFLIGATCILLLSLRHALKGLEFAGIRAEFVLIANSLIMIALSFQILGDRIPNKETTTDLLYSVALILVFLALGSLVIGFLPRYLKPRG
ncbi:MAG: hypothetical protein HXS41_09080 [Theionarchaea archaeon]|nr:hypothetical protein [Theionarchaea archaeon]MBU7017666.1 hypothetical protein [Theionarchaea archaeon]MBU7021199.1 hypothetical protein [Theionarchaea archaeon]